MYNSQDIYITTSHNAQGQKNVQYCLLDIQHIALMNSEHLSLPAQDLHRIKTVNTPVWIGERSTRPHRKWSIVIAADKELLGVMA